MSYFNSTEIENGNIRKLFPKLKFEKVSKFAFALAVISVLLALIIGAFVYQISFKIMEESFQKSFLREARLLAAFAESLPMNIPDEEVLSKVEQFWLNAEGKPKDEYLCVVDINSNLVLHTANPSTIGNYAGSNKILSSEESDVGILADLHNYKVDYVGGYISSSGEYQIAAFKNIENRDWILGVHRSREETESQLSSRLFIPGVGYLIICCLLFPFSMLLLYKTLRKTQKQERETHKSLLENESKFSFFMKKVPVGIAISDKQNNVEFLNAKFVEMFGYTLTDIKTIDDWWVAVYPNLEYRFSEKEEWYRIIEEAEITGQNIKATNTMVRCKDGTDKHIEVVADWIGDNLVSIFLDITEKKIAEESLYNSEKQISTLMANLPGMAYRCLNDPEWTMLFLSEGCSDLTGYAPSTLIGNKSVSYGKLVYKDDSHRIWKEVQNSVKRNIPYQIEYRIVTSDGTIRWVWERGRLVHNEDSGKDVLEGYIMDITDRKDAEMELDKHREKLEELVKERTKELEEKNIELENYNQLFTGREFRIKELKEKIIMLENKLSNQD